jgi:hypothetical protein
MAVRLSALHVGRSLPPGKFPVLISVRLSRPQGHIAAGRIRSNEKPNDLIGNRIRDLLACNIVLQPITLSRAPGQNIPVGNYQITFSYILWVSTDTYTEMEPCLTWLVSPGDRSLGEICGWYLLHNHNFLFPNCGFPCFWSDCSWVLQSMQVPESRVNVFFIVGGVGLSS